MVWHPINDRGGSKGWIGGGNGGVEMEVDMVWHPIKDRGGSKGWLEVEEANH